MRNLRFSILLSAVLLIFALPAAAQDQKAISVAWPQNINSLNPMYTTQTFAGYTYQLFLSPAWDLDADLNPRPVLVEEIPSADNGGISEDGTTFTLNLKEGLTWSDGDPLDSADFIFTYNMVMEEANAPVTTAPFDRIATIEAPDPQTVVIGFDAPYAAWLGLFSYVLPEHILAPVFEADGSLQNAEFNRNPSVGSGAYVPADVDLDNFIRFEANENFTFGRPNIDIIVVEFVPDDQAYVANLAANEVQLGTFVPPNEVAGLNDAGMGVEILPSGYNEGWFMNTSEELAHPAMTDVRVREAIALGFDRATVVSDLLDGVLPAGASWWENTPYANPELDPVPYDPDRARELLDEAGWVVTGDPLVEDGDGLRAKDGTELRLRFATNTRGIRQDIQAIAQQQLGEIGIDIIIENYPSDTFFAGFADGGPAATGEYDIAEWSSSPNTFPDPDTSRFTCDQIPSPDSPNGGNWNYYCNEELDELFDLQTTLTDPAERAAAFHQIDEIVYSDYVWVGVWHDADIWVISPDLVNTNLNGVTPFWDVVNWDVN